MKLRPSLAWGITAVGKEVVPEPRCPSVVPPVVLLVRLKAVDRLDNLDVVGGGFPQCAGAILSTMAWRFGVGILAPEAAAATPPDFPCPRITKAGYSRPHIQGCQTPRQTPHCRPYALRTGRPNPDQILMTDRPGYPHSPAQHPAASELFPDIVEGGPGQDES